MRVCPSVRRSVTLVSADREDGEWLLSCIRTCLVASTQLYKRVCRSVTLSLGGQRLDSVQRMSCINTCYFRALLLLPNRTRLFSRVTGLVFSLSLTLTPCLRKRQLVRYCKITVYLGAGTHFITNPLYYIHERLNR